MFHLLKMYVHTLLKHPEYWIGQLHFKRLPGTQRVLLCSFKTTRGTKKESESAKCSDGVWPYTYCGKYCFNQMLHVIWGTRTTDCHRCEESWVWILSDVSWWKANTHPVLKWCVCDLNKALLCPQCWYICWNVWTNHITFNIHFLWFDKGFC